MRTPPLLEGPSRPQHRRSRWWIGIPLLVVVLPLSLWWLTRPVEPRPTQAPYAGRHPEPTPEQRASDRLRADERVREWAVIIKSKQLTPTEELSEVDIPSTSGIPFSDLHCLIYKNSEYRTVQFICPRE